MTEPRDDLWTTRVPATSRTGPAIPAPRAAPARHAGGARRPPARRRRGGLFVVLVLVAMVAMLVGLAQCVAARDRPTIATTVVPTAVIPGAGAAATPTAPDPGSLVAGSTSLFAAARSGDRGLALLAGQTANGHAVPVQSVPADEGFWIGSSPTDRVWVQFTSNVESGVTITPGQLLDLNGAVVTHGADYAVKAGVPAQDGAEQLTRQGAHLEADPNQVEVVGTR